MIRGSDGLGAVVRYGGLTIGAMLILLCTYIIVNRRVGISIQWRYSSDGGDVDGGSGSGDDSVGVVLREDAPLLQ